MPDLLVVVPTRGRPEALGRMVAAWTDTGAWGDADLAFVVDTDDPALPDYRAAAAEADVPLERVQVADVWRPLVPKLNLAANLWADAYFALGYMGDDNLPRTPGWAGVMLAALRDMGTGVVYGDDLFQRERLCSSWVMTSDIVRALGRMVPAPVEHMFCDNAVMELARRAGCLRYLPQVVVEHMHPLAGKAEWDPGYHRVNLPVQYERDGLAWAEWLGGGLDSAAAIVRDLRTVRA